jgi:hypothetical protein
VELEGGNSLPINRSSRMKAHDFFHDRRRPMDTMDGFDAINMSYMGNSMPLGLLPHTDYLQSNSGMDMHDHLSNFDADTYLKSVVVSLWKYHVLY